MKILPSWILMGKYSESGGAQYLQKNHKSRAMEMINPQMSDDRTVSCQLCVVKNRKKSFPANLESGGDPHGMHPASIQFPCFTNSKLSIQFSFIVQNAILFLDGTPELFSHE